jgi:hypothetical protein
MGNEEWGEPLAQRPDRDFDATAPMLPKLTRGDAVIGVLEALRRPNENTSMIAQFSGASHYAALSKVTTPYDVAEMWLPSALEAVLREIPLGTRVRLVCLGKRPMMDGAGRPKKTKDGVGLHRWEFDVRLPKATVAPPGAPEGEDRGEDFNFESIPF